jgi:hypothetical protein
MAARDPDYRIITYRSENADAGKEWLARVDHPRTKLAIFFEAPTEAEVIGKASAWWEQFRAQREAAWKARDEAKAARQAKDAAKAAEVPA